MGAKTLLVILSILAISTAHRHNKVKKKYLKYILLWTSNSTEPFSYFKKGRKSFNDRNCKHQNCYVYNNGGHFKDIQNFDAVLFNIASLQDGNSIFNIPQRRSENQKYILVSTNPSYSISSEYNNFFNLTWTYRLDSDIKWTNLIIRDIFQKVTGPERDMHWVSSEIIQEATLEFDFNKNKAVAFMAPYCDVRSDRDRYVEEIDKALRVFGYNVDKYRTCINRKEKNCRIYEYGFKERTCMECPDDNLILSCDNEIEFDYYFLLALEDHFGEDFVGRNLLFALQHYLVPIVAGGVDYSHFMPDDAYINANALTPQEVADKMVHLINNPDAYKSMFKWRKYYSYHAPEHSPETDPICQLCAFLNDKKKMREKHVYKDISAWLHGDGFESNTYSLSHPKGVQIIDLHNFKYKMNSKICDRSHYLYFIRVVVSAVYNFKVRESIREIWMNDTDNSDVVFMVGETHDKNVARKLKDEHKIYGDIVQGNFLDSINNLTYKHVMALDWVTKYCPAVKYLVKTDDSVFVNYPVLKELFKNGEVTDDLQIICGFVPSNSRKCVHKDAIRKYYSKEKESVGDKFPEYCTGSLVIYNAKIAPLLVAAARTQPYFPLDDVFVTGILRSKFNITVKNIYHLVLRKDDTSNTLKQRGQFLFGYNYNIDEMEAIWAFLKDKNLKNSRRAFPIKGDSSPIRRSPLPEDYQWDVSKDQSLKDDSNNEDSDGSESNEIDHHEISADTPKTRLKFLKFRVRT